MRTRAVGEYHAVADLAGERDHALAQGGKDDRRQFADAGVRLELGDEAGDIGEGLPAAAPMRACVGAWLTPMPRRKRPPETSCMKAALCAKSPTVRA